MRCRTTSRLALMLALACGLAHAQDAPLVAPTTPTRPDDRMPPQDGEAPGVGLFRLLFQVDARPPDDARVSGLPAGRAAVVVDLKRACELALIRFRAAKPGRFEPLDVGQVAARADEVGAGDFARFRKDFTANPEFPDPSGSLLDLQSRLARIENDLWHLWFLDRRAGLSREMLASETSGVRPIDVDQFELAASDARFRIDREIVEYRGQLDMFKWTLGLSPRAPVAIDRAPLAAFRRVFEEADRWLLSPDRSLEALDRHSARLPTPGEVVVEGRSILGEIEEDPGRMEEVLGLVTRLAAGGPVVRDETGFWEVTLRDRVRRLVDLRADYQQARLASTHSIRQMGDLGEQILDPESVRNTPGRSGRLMIEIPSYAQKVAEGRTRLVTLWNRYNAERLALNRDLGLFPFENWESFSAQFEARPSAVAEPPAAADPPAPGPAGLEPPPTPIPPK